MQPFGFTGCQREAMEGLYYAQAREYDAGSGRFFREDPIKGILSEPMTQNPYLYCMNQPLDWVDRDGMCPKKDTKGLFQSPYAGVSLAQYQKQSKGTYYGILSLDELDLNGEKKREKEKEENQKNIKKLPLYYLLQGLQPTDQANGYTLDQKKTHPMLYGIADGLGEGIKELTIDPIMGIYHQIKGLCTEPKKTLKQDARTLETISFLLSPTTVAPIGMDQMPATQMEIEKQKKEAYEAIWDEIESNFTKNVTNGNLYTGAKYFSHLAFTIGSVGIGWGKVSELADAGKVAKAAEAAGKAAETGENLEKISKVLPKVETAEEGAKDGEKILKKTGDAAKGGEGGLSSVDESIPQKEILLIILRQVKYLE